MSFTASPSEAFGRQIEGQRHHRELALVIHCDRNRRLLQVRERAQRHLASVREHQGRCRWPAAEGRAGRIPSTGAPIDWPAVACATDELDGPKPAVLVEPPETKPDAPGARGRANKQIPQIDRIVLEPGLHFQHHVILVQLREHGGHFALAIGVVKRVVDRRGRDAQARGGIAVENHAHAQAVHLLIGCHVAQLGNVLQPRHHLRHERIQLVGVGIFQRVLILRAADAILHGQILHRLHVQRDARHLGQFGCSRRMTSLASILRSSSGFRLI